MINQKVMFGNGFINEAKYSKKAQETIGKKMSAMKGEKKPQAQKVAIAINAAKQKGLKTPENNVKILFAGSSKLHN